MKKNILFLFTIILFMMIGFLFYKKTAIGNKDELSPQKAESTEANNSINKRADKESNSLELDRSSSSTPVAFQLLNDSLLLELTFHDSQLADQEKSRISEDLNQLYSHLHIKVNEFDKQKYLTFEGKGRSWPNKLDKVFKVREVGEQLILDIPKSVCEAYRDAFKFMDENIIDEKKVQRLLNDAETGNLTVESIAVISVPDSRREEKEEMIHYMNNFKFKMPSILSYRNENINGVEYLRFLRRICVEFC